LGLLLLLGLGDAVSVGEVPALEVLGLLLGAAGAEEDEGDEGADGH
jgi:hypothetical protein